MYTEVCNLYIYYLQYFFIKNGYYIKNSMHICTSSVDIIVITPVNFYIKIAKKFLNNLLTTNNNFRS